jgi:four helix bundle protein
MAPYERFAAWQHSHRLVLSVYQATQKWPRHEMFGLVSQARRAAVSVPSNLAEGSAKRGSREFSRYLDIANGSLSELEYLLRLARDLGYLERNRWETIEAQRDVAGRSLWGLYAAIRRRTPRA